MVKSELVVKDNIVVIHNLEMIKRYITSCAEAVGDKVHGHIQTLDYCIEHFKLHVDCDNKSNGHNTRIQSV